MKRPFQFLFIVLLLTFGAYSQSKFAPPLVKTVDEAIRNNTTVKALIVLKDRVDIHTLNQQLYAEKVSVHQRAVNVVSILQRTAREAQGELLTYLEARKVEGEVNDFRSFWIINMISIEAQPSVLFELEERPDIAYLQVDGVLQIDEPLDPAPAPRSIPNGHEPGLEAINADLMWQAGITGDGTIVMNIDSGVNGNHPALDYKWRGNSVPASQAWFDFFSGSTFPFDSDGSANHGTHTMGTITGLDPATNDTVGVAPGAEWIAARGASGTAGNIASFQWALDPDGNPNTTDDMPCVINNSYRDPSVTTECDPALNPYIDVIGALEAAGVAVIWSAGNSGPGASTVTPPKNVNLDLVGFWATGALNGNTPSFPIANFSSRGPVVSECLTGNTSLDIKPEASAPGVSVRSSQFNGYGFLSGTSMAAPHVSGAIALLKEAHPNKTGHQLKLALYLTAVDLGTQGEDNAYGMGIIDIWAAHQRLLNGNSDEQIAAFPEDVDFGQHFTGADSDTETVAITNLGDLDLTVSNIQVSGADFSLTGLPALPATLGQFASENFQAVYTPTTTGVVNGTVTITSSDPSNPSLEISLTAEGLVPPVIEVSAASINFDVAADEMDTTALTISNTGGSGAPNLDWTATKQEGTLKFANGQTLKVSFRQPEPDVDFASRLGIRQKYLQNSFAGAVASKNSNLPETEGAGGPDAFGYNWIDSNDPNGPEFDWQDITGVGTSINLGDDAFTEIALPFTFPFYGNDKNLIKITSNGYLTFGTPAAFGGHDPIPNPNNPNDLIATFWTDLDPTEGGTIHHHFDGANNVFIVQYTNIQLFGGSDPYTFQVILAPDGSIKYQYLDMRGNVNNATVGIENINATIGLQVVNDAAYVENSMAVLIQEACPWLDRSPSNGSIAPGSSQEIDVIVDATGLPDGIYECNLIILSNDPANSAASIPVTMNVGSANEFNQEVLSGWNIIGRPLNVADSSVSTLYPDHEPNSLFSWNGSYQGGSEVARCTGYWLRFPAGATVPINGTSQSSCTINLIQGWNLIAGPSCDVPIANIDDPSGVITGTIFGWGGNYFNATSINQGLGYWVNASGPGTITISCASAASKYQPFRLESAVDMSRLATIDIRDANGHSQSLYFNAALNEGQTLNSFMLPPVSPAGTFDARLAGDYRLTEGDEATIKLQTTHYPVTVDFSNLPLLEGAQYVVREMAGNVELGTHSVSEGQTITISNAQVTTLQLSKINDALPQAFALEQNYPNPFNPTTEIRYAIPQAEKVAVVIYNALGQKVKTLVNSRQDAGFYTTIWDATNDAGQPVSSGVYLYSVTAGQHYAIKKMVFLK